MSNKLKAEALKEHLLLQGAIEISGIDSNTGEVIYSITDILEEVHPELFEELRHDFEGKMYQMIYAGPKVMSWKFDTEFFNV